MNFVTTLLNSIYSPRFYTTIPQKSLGSAIRYFLLLSILITLLHSAVPIWTMLTIGQQRIHSFFNQTVSLYPQELEVKIKSGKVSTNVSEPYFVRLPESSDEEKNLVVIDTKTPYSAAKFNEYNSIAWVANDTIFFQRSNSPQKRNIDLTKVSDFILNKAFVDSTAQKISPWLNIITPIAIIGILLAIFLGTLAKLLYLLFFAALLWLLIKIVKKPLTYGNSYRIGLYAMTFGLLLEVITSWVHFKGFPFMFTLVTLAIIVINLNSEPKNSTSLADVLIPKSSSKKKA